jgi:PAS domain S-box-containing protein
MGKKDNISTTQIDVLPKVLKRYEPADFAIRQKARFIFYICIAMIICMIFIIISDSYLSNANLPVIILDITLLILFIVCLFVLIRGFYGFSTHLLMSSTFLCVWLIMYVDRGDIITRFDTVVLIVALLNLAPLFITKYKSTILFYIFFNITLLGGFILVYGNQLGLSHTAMFDYMMDTSVAIFFTGIVGYNIFSINKRTLDRALIEINERRLTEAEFKKSEEKYKYLMENLNEVVMMVDNNDRVLFVNKKFTEKLGYTAEEIIGEIGYKKLLNPEDHEIIIKKNKERINKEINQYELSFRAKDGQKIDFLVSGAPMIDSEGNTFGSIGAMIDITERKLAENALKESEARYRKLIEAFPDIIMVSDLKGNIIFGNQALEKTIGITPADYNNPNRKAHIHPDDAYIVTEAFKELLASSKSQSGIVENRFIDSSGNLHWFSGIMAKVFLNERMVIQTISRDITEKKKIEEDLEKYRNHLEILVKERTDELALTNEELRIANENLYNQKEELQTALDELNDTQKQLIQSEKMASLGILATGIAHEINNPLNFINGGILGLETYFRDNLNTHFENVSFLIEAMHEGVKRTTDIVTSLSHYSRRDDLPRSNCEIHDIIDHCLVMLHSQLKNKVEIQKYYTVFPCPVFGSEGKLHQAILNVIANAGQSIESNGVISISTNIINHDLIISISDTGCGISKENLEKIFDPFFTTKEPGKGIGLGLSITYKIIQEHNGTLEYESELGKGTKVILKLPINTNKI